MLTLKCERVVVVMEERVSSVYQLECARHGIVQFANRSNLKGVWRWIAR